MTPLDHIERAYHSKRRIRLFYGDTETGKAWAEEFGTIGTVGRSTGREPCFLLIHNARSMGGGAILMNSIVGIQCAPGTWLYRHPSLDLGQWAIAPSDLPQYAAAVTHNGAIHARFNRPARAERYAAFMRGDRWAK